MDNQNTNRVLLNLVFGASCLIFGYAIALRPEILGEELNNVVAVAVVALMLVFLREALRSPMSAHNGYTKSQVAVALGSAVVITITIMLCHTVDALVLALMLLWSIMLLVAIHRPSTSVSTPETTNTDEVTTEEVPIDADAHLLPGMR